VDVSDILGDSDHGKMHIAQAYVPLDRERWVSCCMMSGLNGRHVTRVPGSGSCLESVLIDRKTHIPEKSSGWVASHHRLPSDET
jgi:hypothetical protein